MAEMQVTGRQLLQAYEVVTPTGVEIQFDGVWRQIYWVVTDYGDPTEPVLVDMVNPTERRLIHVDDQVTVRGLTL